MGENTMPQETNSGSTYQRKGDGKWVAALSLGGGKRIVRYAATKRAAQAILQAMQREHHVGQLAPPTRLTLAEWTAQWLDTLTLRPTTLWTYRTHLRPVLDALGQQRIDKLTPLAVSATLTQLQRGG